MSISKELLEYEFELRNAEDRAHLQFIVTHHIRKITGSELCFLSRRNQYSKLKVVAASNLVTIDQSSPQINCVNRLLKKFNASENVIFGDTKGLNLDNSEASLFPPYFAIIKLLSKFQNDNLSEYLVIFRYRSFLASEKSLLQLLSDNAVHAMLALDGRKKNTWTLVNKLKGYVYFGVLIIVLSCLFFIKVPLSVVAPVEVVPRNARIISAPFNGVISKIYVVPGQFVDTGDVILEYDRTELDIDIKRAKAALAFEKARLSQISNQGTIDSSLRGEKLILEAKVKVSSIELEQAILKQQKSVIIASQPGYINLDRADYLQGLPVQTGDRILSIIDPENIHVKLELPTSNAIKPDTAKEVRISFDHKPLNSWSGSIVHSDFEPSLNSKGILSYAIYLQLNNNFGWELPRVGQRGNARLSGPTVRLGYQVFRKPILMLKKVGVL